MSRILALCVLVSAALAAGVADAQTYYYSYSSPAVVASPTVTYYGGVPTTTYYAPSVTYGSGYTSYYAPTTTYYAAPTTTYYSAPVTSYYAPYTTYSPVTTYYAPGVVGSTIYGTPQVYVPGQPVRNLLRSVIP